MTKSTRTTTVHAIRLESPHSLFHSIFIWYLYFLSPSSLSLLLSLFSSLFLSSSLTLSFTQYLSGIYTSSHPLLSLFSSLFLSSSLTLSFTQYLSGIYTPFLPLLSLSSSLFFFSLPLLTSFHVPCPYYSFSFIHRDTELACLPVGLLNTVKVKKPQVQFQIC